MPKPHVMIIEARFYEDIANDLARGATRALEAAGATHERIAVPGAFELPAAVQMAVRAMHFQPARKRYDGYVALGCVIRGETSHYDIVCNETARALQGIAVQYTLAFGFGLLTCETDDQAYERADPDKLDKGGEAARACLTMIDLKRRFGLFPR